MRTIHRPLAAAALAAAALAPAAAAQAATKTVTVGAQSKAAPEAGLYGFFPKTVKIHAGDSVKYKVNAFAEVYSGPRSGIGPLATADSALVSGVNDAAGNPFWFNGKLPTISLNPLFGPPAGDGKVHKGQKDVDHGALGEKLTLSFAKPGSYKVYDALHPTSKNTVVVVPKGKKIPSAAADKAAAAKQIAKLVPEAKKLSAYKAPADTIRVGNDTKNVGFYKFFTGAITAGKPVTVAPGKTLDDVHDLVFTSNPEYAAKLAGSFFPTLQMTGKVMPELAYPSQDPTANPSFDGTQNGGFFNTGAFDRDSRTPFADKATVTFTKPGTYSYVCLFHADFMKGTITVK